MPSTLNRPLVVTLLGIVGFFAFAHQAAAAPHPITGTWRDKSTLGESDFKITESLAEDGSFDVREMGLGNAVGWATFKEGTLIIHFVAGEVRGFYAFHVDEKHERGRGKLVFTRFPDDFGAGEVKMIGGKTVREIPDVELKRVGR